MWGLVKLVCHNLLSACRGFSLLAMNPPQSSHELLEIESLKRVVQRKEPQRAEPVDPNINRVSWVGVDPIRTSSSSRRSRFRRRSFPAILRLL
jgi:hypothetical protein